MQMNILQSIIKRQSEQISTLDLLILNEKAGIKWAKEVGQHKDYFEYRYKRLEKLRKELAALVKIQRKLKDETALIVELEREDKYYKDFSILPSR